MGSRGGFYRTGSIQRRVVIPYTELDVMERRHAMKVLLVLRDRGTMNKTELVESLTSGAGSVQTRIDELCEAGLLMVDEENVRPFRKMISLSEKGKRVADLIEDIRSILSDRFRRSRTACIS
ncbi:MAG: hypothetical protein J5674_02610 [Candidatus Methanomethylophilaceae archaeon]|nr:hypothetical protein [Candidatus Methanomethylophilaceae archaeon]